MEKLIPDFYNTISTKQMGDNTYEVKVSMNPDAEVYKGHFPGQPVAPGACLTQMVKEVVNEISGQEMRLTEAQQIKFLATVNPITCPELTLDLTINQSEAGLKMKCTAKDETTSYFKISGILA
jgi:3-hydroxyacyl-[acyl-carrier-protein] dehydratase